MKKTHFTIFISIIMMIFSSCAHEHQFQPATCTKPQVCIECGESMGESLGHDYTDATCTKPQICTKCDEIVGEPLGHDYTASTCIRAMLCMVCGETTGEPSEHKVAVGKCSTCGSFQNEELVTSIKNKLTEAQSSIDIFLIYLNSKSDNNQSIYNAIINMQTYMTSSKTDLTEAKKICGDYSELSETKSAIENAMDMFPSLPTSTDLSVLLNYLDKLELYVSAVSNAQVKILFVK